MTNLSSALVIIIGWFVVHELSARRDLAARRENARRGHLERQISELYGPLLGLIEHSGAAFDIAAHKLPCNDAGGIAFDRFSSEHERVWRFFVERYFIPTNAQIRALIRTKMHLLEDGRLPPSFAEFFRHEANFEALHQLWKDEGIESLDIQSPAWPANFQGDVEHTLASLRKRHQELI